nr:MAG TPA: hypothetical protein [Caudoviricetes sp.]
MRRCLMQPKDCHKPVKMQSGQNERKESKVHG